jgi:bifunctional non-homologous end joining protein LigD
VKLPRIQPIAPTRIPAPFDDPDFVWELKFDGWRCVVYLDHGGCELVSRNGNTYKGFTRLAKAVAGLKVQDAIIDAEVVCLDGEGKSVFLDLMRKRKVEATLYAFDLLWHDGEDLRHLPLLDRKRKLQRLLKGQNWCLYAEHFDKGTALFQAACDKDLEGIVAKHKLAPYSSKPQSWFKVINESYSQHRGRREMFDSFHEARP